VQARSVARAAAPVAAGAVLVAVAVGGIRASRAIELDFRSFLPSAPRAFETALVATAVLGVPLILLSMLLRRARADGEDGKGRWWPRLALLVAVVVAGLVIQRMLPRSDSDDAPRDGDPLEVGDGLDVIGWSTWAGVLAAGLAVAAGVTLLWRARAPRADPEPPTTADHDHETAAVRAATAALDEQPGDPRGAVVACYAAMEDALASAGTSRRGAETPEELLARAVADGRLSAGPGRQLTELFLVARYSSAPVTEDDVAACRSALRRIDVAVDA
jgi:hypothetical protein